MTTVSDRKRQGTHKEEERQEGFTLRRISRVHQILSYRIVWIGLPDLMNARYFSQREAVEFANEHGAKALIVQLVLFVA